MSARRPQIFDKVSDQIAQRVDQRDPRVINERHNQLMQDYLDVTQRKEPCACPAPRFRVPARPCRAALLPGASLRSRAGGADWTSGHRRRCVPRFARPSALPANPSALLRPHPTPPPAALSRPGVALPHPPPLARTVGVFRDIIIEAEYDPMSCHTNHIKYQNRIRHDPCKLELRQHAHKPMDAMGRSEFSKPRGTGVTPRLPVGLWDKLDSTPYGRSEKLLPRLDAAASYRLHNRVTQNEFQVERGRAVLQREIPLGKRCFYGAR